MELDQDQAMSDMSLAMNRRFDTSGFSEYERMFGYSVGAIREVMSNTTQNKTFSKIVGSIAEGTDFLFSDSDILMIDQCSTVGYNPQEATCSNKVYLLLISGTSTRAGYTKLQVYRNGKPHKIDYKKSFQHYDNHFVHIYKGKSFLTNKTILPMTLPSHRKPLYRKPLNTENHGPAATSTFSGHTIDSVPAYESNIIPNEMMPWFKRHRPYNWPTKETCDMFKSMGCCYVGVGHLKSHDNVLEWRISPTRQELYLMLNLNPTQFRCYITLKAIKKTNCDDMLSSYHCKTALFYTIENNDPDIWQPHNLIQCVLKCLKLLLCWVKKRNCPNYFIPEENMFETKLIDNYKIEKLQVIFEKLICNCLENCLMLMIFLNDFKPEMVAIWGKATDLKMTLKNIFTQCCSLSRQRNRIFAIIEKLKCPTEQNSIEEIKMLRPYEPDFVLLGVVLEKRILHIKRFEHLLSVMRRRMKVNKYLEIHKDITETLPEDFQYCLKLASIATAQKDYAMCDNLLRKSRHILYRANVICCCILIDDITTYNIDESFYAKDFKLTLAGKCINSMSILDILQQFTMCLSFIESELEGGIVVAPLHLEAYKTVGKSRNSKVLSDRMNTMEDLMSLHPVAYMYFLQYKNSEMMIKKSDMCVALENLEHINLVSLHEGIYSHADVILNLLGHIYKTKGWYKLALRCFRKSWLLFPVTSAEWHIMFLLFGSCKNDNNRSLKKKKVYHR